MQFNLVFYSHNGGENEGYILICLDNWIITVTFSLLPMVWIDAERWMINNFINYLSFGRPEWNWCLSRSIPTRLRQESVTFSLVPTEGLVWRTLLSLTSGEIHISAGLLSETFTTLFFIPGANERKLGNWPSTKFKNCLSCQHSSGLHNHSEWL